jgi:hypothetical protein
MNRQLMRVCLIALLISLTASFSPAPSAASTLKDESSNKAAFHDAMRKLWQDHITWKRVFIGDQAKQDDATNAGMPMQIKLLTSLAAQIPGTGGKLK